MDELTPQHANSTDPDELGVLRTRMADAVAGCARCLATVVILSEATPQTPAARRERCDDLCDAINSLSDHSGEFHQAHRDAGGGWPADAPTGLTFNAVALTLHDAYFLSCELERTLCGLGLPPSPRTAAQVTGQRRAVTVLEDAAEYLRPGGEWSPAVAAPFDAERVNAAHRAEVTAAAEYGVLVLGHVIDVDGRQVPVTGNSCLVVPGRVPTVCPHANPRVGPTVMGLVQSVLLEGVQRELLHGAVLPDGATLHWIGRVAAAGGSGTCPCHPAAPTAAPAHAHLWAGVATATQASAATLAPVNAPGQLAPAPDGQAVQGVASLRVTLDAEPVRRGDEYAAISLILEMGPNVSAIARRCGLKRQSLQRMPAFMTAIQLARGRKQQARRRLTGSVYGRDASRANDPDND